ncbi:MAG TPA: hypothetical protein VF476_00085 [Chitinophagaceae bacterium]
MQRDFNNKDFEHFVKQNADQYRMFPSEKVWQGINNSLHRRQRRYGLGLILLLLLTGSAVTLVMTNPPQHDQADGTIASANPVKENTTASEDNNSSNSNTKKTKIVAPEPAAVVNQLAYTIPQLNQQPEAIFTSPADASVAHRNTEAPINPLASHTIAAPSLFAVNNIPVLPVHNTRNSFSNNGPANIGSDPSSSIISAVAPNNILTDEVAATTTHPETTKKQEVAEPVYYSNESVPVVVTTPRSKPSVSRKKFSMQFYFTPTVSYRKLSENKKFLQAAASNGTIPLYAAYSDIDNYVNHKPDMGLELGMTGKYALTERLKLRGGLQFNVSRYDIKAAYEQRREDATIALEGNIFGPNQTQTITKKTNYRNFNGNSVTNWLKNLYYSVSLPIGVEYTFNSQTKTHFGVAATFQPTYIIKDRAYLITTDYKNYVEVPSLVRKWNMNTSFETFIAYSTGNINWQVGPQIRYQIQSSFIAKYPVKENLFDFGLKVGIQLNR